MNTTQIDRSAFSVGSLADEPDDLGYWLSQKPEDRLAGIEFLRRQFYGDGACNMQIQRYFEVVELGRE